MTGAQRFDPGRPTLDPNGADYASAWFVIVVCFAGVFVLLVTRPTLWVFAVGMAGLWGLLGWAIVRLCRRPEDTPNPTDQEPGYLP